MPETSPILSRSGLNLHAVFDVAALPAEVRQPLCAAAGGYRQLHLFGHGGRQLWRALQASEHAGRAEPVDDFSAQTVRRYFAEELRTQRYRLLFPGGERPVPLQRLGELAGWHFASPFRIGVNREWGSWFAYRAVALADTALPPTPKAAWGSPCETCAEKPCLAACPGGALADGALRLDCCIDYRLAADSQCRRQCLSRLACPVAAGHRYSAEQVAYHYGRSLATIEAWRRGS